MKHDACHPHLAMNAVERAHDVIVPLAALLAMAFIVVTGTVSAVDDGIGTKPRMVAMTDIGGDPDDRQSMVRFLLYCCDFEVEGLCTGFGHGHYETTRPELIREAVDAYGKVLPNLRKHRPDYPSREKLLGLIKDGHNGDPHKDRLTYRWWVYREAGGYWADAPIQDADKADAVLTAPANASGRTIHVILEVTDKGKPPLTAYRRVILKVSGKPIKPPPGVFGVEEDLITPITKLVGPPAKTEPWQFYRGININGSVIEIDGNRWDGDDARDFECKGRPLNSPHVMLRPPTDPARAKMIHSFRWDRNASLSVANVPKGTYAVYAYVWEETDPETLTIRLNDRIVQRNYNSGLAGQWRRIGPWISEVNNGRIAITASGGAANFSGIEIWRRADGGRS